MLVFNEGVPRAGKSYDGVKNHILPALKKGRRVYARLNGLNHERIAAYLKLPVERVRDLLVLVDSGDVKAKFSAVQGVGEIWGIPDELKDALIVIDEVHEFYVTDRAPLPPQQEQFFALIGQNGGDVLILTQWIKRVHPAVRARIERKNVFQKLTAVGMKSKYRVTYWQTVAPDKYERVGGKTERYDPAIFPLYHGYAVGADNVEVYEEGGTNVWRAMLPKALLFGTAGLLGAYAFLSFFLSGGEALGGKRPDEIASPVPVVSGATQAVQTTAQKTVETPQQRRAREEAERLEALTPGQRYVVELGERGRARLAGRMDVDGFPWLIVEWLDDQGNAIERLSGRQLAALEVGLSVTAAGVALVAGTETVIATNWPAPRTIREPEARLYRLDSESAGPRPSVSEPSAGGLASPGATHATGTATGYGQVASYGAFGYGEQPDYGVR